MKYLIRTRLAKDIVCEVAFPVRQQGKVALVCGGAPGTPFKKEVLNFLASKGYVAFGIRYRGTWESEGIFLKDSPAKDVKDIIDHLVKHKNIVDIRSGIKMPLKIKSIDLFGASFGGPAVLLNSKHTHVRKTIALCPVIDWNRDGTGEPFEEYVRFSEEGFGGVYRVKNKSDWKKLLRKDFYNPITMTDQIDPKKCFIIQTQDDDSCPVKNVKAIQTLLPISVYYKPKGGHVGISRIPHKFFWKKIENFLHKK
jgi:pimeloyl-ACP methyl ester carboxylesterase